VAVDRIVDGGEKAAAVNERVRSTGIVVDTDDLACIVDAGRDRTIGIGSQRVVQMKP
jgi:hypothetical protein